MPFANAAQSAVEDSPMRAKSHQRRIDRALENPIERAEVDAQQLEQQLPIVRFLHAVEASLLIDVAAEATIEMTHKSRGQKEIVRDNVGREMREIAQREGLFFFRLRRFEQAQSG